MSDKYHMPTSIDEPFRLFLLTVDELFLLVFPIIMLGFVFNQMILGFACGILSLTLIKKFKGEQGHFYLMHLAYWYLANIVIFKATPPSYIREYLG